MASVKIATDNMKVATPKPSEIVQRQKQEIQTSEARARSLDEQVRQYELEYENNDSENEEETEARSRVVFIATVGRGCTAARVSGSWAR